MAGTNRMDGASQHRPHLAAEALAAINEQVAMLEDAGPVLIGGLDDTHNLRDLEHQLQRALMNRPEVTFSSLTVQWVDGSVCLQGLLEYDETVPDVCQLARQFFGAESVVNQLVIRPAGGIEPEERATDCE